MLAGFAAIRQLIQINAIVRRGALQWRMDFLLVAAALTLTAPGPDMGRGAMLYENHCTICHTSVVHVREDHRATSDVEVESWVRRWSTDQKLGWSQQDVDDVTSYLLQTFYKF